MGSINEKRLAFIRDVIGYYPRPVTVGTLARLGHAMGLRQSERWASDSVAILESRGTIDPAEGGGYRKHSQPLTPGGVA